MAISAFAGSLVGSALVGILDRLLPQDLKSGEKSRTIIDGIVRPSRTYVRQKRTPKALTDLMAYQAEIKEEGENRG